MNSVFDVSMVRDKTYKRVHYPSYRVRRNRVGISSSLEGAVRLMHEVAGTFDDIHHFNVSEIPLYCISYTGECRNEWVYDREGVLIDCRLISNMIHGESVFAGRTPEQIRFTEGDIVEVHDGEEIHLGFVVSLPPSVEKAAKVNANTVFHMDDTDDSYVILTEEDYRSHDHVDSLRVFRPQFRIHPNVERRLRTAYQNYITRDMRSRIAMTTTIERIKQAMADDGVECRIGRYFDELIFVTVLDRPEKGKSAAIIIETSKAFRHLDRVLLTLHRFTGRPQPGRGYSLHSVKGHFPADVSQSFELK